MKARILDVTAAQYHADPLPTPSLSSSLAHVLLSQSPQHAYLLHPKLGGKVREATKTMDGGTLAHELLLGVGGGLVVIDADDFKSKAAREARDVARSAGQTPVLKSAFEDAKVAVEQWRARLEILGIVLSGKSEVAVTWDEEPIPGRPVACRGMIDHLKIDRGVIYDLKTIRSAHPKVCARHMIEYGYDVQYAAYTRALEALRPELAGRTDFVFLFCETEPPYCITPARPNGTMRELGRTRWDRAVGLWNDCLTFNKWPGYADGIIELEAPPWAITAEMGSAA